MTDRSELESMTTHELHNRAMARARHHLDVGFLWSLIKAVPVVEAAAGHLSESETDVVSMTSLLTDVLGSGEGDAAEALRPLYIDYLAAHQI